MQQADIAAGRIPHLGPGAGDAECGLDINLLVGLICQEINIPAGHGTMCPQNRVALKIEFLADL